MTVLGLARLWALACSAACGLVAAQTPDAVSLASPDRGKALLLQRHDSGCVLCHQVQGLPVGGTQSARR